ncbi:hypothetical protein GXW71_08440 [Roseomonas hellenica]|uniref:Protein-L-isoaspartate O-methyltransferase n=1 Tax=Plastoroseomonas hellenica TaxID=2687306 RepID=A0ABS5EVQ8_9PROT|nr:hypothetical protein [Plastoroseomonas hellenica]
MAARSLADLEALGLDNVKVVTGDGTRGFAADAPYDRAVVTAATWNVPTALLDQVVEGGRVLVPVELRSGDGCDVTVLERRGPSLVDGRAVPGWFVPLLGDGQNHRATAPSMLPHGEPTAHFALPLGEAGHGPIAAAAAVFRAYLGRTEPGFVIRADGDLSWRPGMPMPPFGLAEADGSVAFWAAGELVTYGGRVAAERFARAYAPWAAALGLPGTGTFRLEVHHADAAPPAADGPSVEVRGENALLWRLRAGLGDWRLLTGPEQGRPSSKKRVKTRPRSQRSAWRYPDVLIAGSRTDPASCASSAVTSTLSICAARRKLSA